MGSLEGRLLSRRGAASEVQMFDADTHIADWVQLIRAEYLEIPGLRLTKPQVERLWGLDHVTSDALLSALVDVKFLRRTRQDAYVRADVG
jgi:hypothetical protein